MSSRLEARGYSSFAARLLRARRAARPARLRAQRSPGIFNCTCAFSWREENYKERLLLVDQAGPARDLHTRSGPGDSGPSCPQHTPTFRGGGGGERRQGTAGPFGRHGRAPHTDGTEPLSFRAAQLVPPRPARPAPPRPVRERAQRRSAHLAISHSSAD